MNMVPTQNFTPEYEVNGLEKTETSNPKLARLMKAWEGKQTKAVRNISTLGLMAVGLSACGGSDDDNDDGDTDPTDPPVTGETFSLTIGDDNITGTDFADVFNALLASAEGSLTGVLGLQTLGDTDVINGGDGTDILNAVVNGTGLAIFDFAAPLITNVEIYNLTSRNDAGGLDLNNASGYTQLWNINSSGDLTLVNVEEAAALGLRGTEGGTTYSVEYTSSAAADIVEQLVIANGVGGSTLSGLFTTLDVAAPGDGIEDLTLQVSNGVRMILADAVADIEDLTIEGSGLLVLSADDSFDNLVSLTSTAYTGDLTLDVSGSTVLTSVETGAGADVITINRLAADGGLSVDLGEGSDILELAGSFNSVAVTALDFEGGVVGVENLAFAGSVGLDNAAILDLEGFNADLETVWFFAGLDGNGNELTLAGSPVDDLRINSTFIDSLDLDTGNVVNLEVNTSAGELDIDGLAGDALETLVLNQSGDGDLWLDVVGGVDDLNALTSIEVNASNDDTYNTASVDIVDDAGSLTDGLQSLASVSVVSDDAAELTMMGADSGIIAAQDAVADAEADVTAAAADVATAEAGVMTAEDMRDQALVDQGLAQSDLDDAQDDFDAAQAVVDAEEDDVAAAQAVVNAETADVAAAQADLDAAQADLDAAQDAVDDFNAYLAAFDYDVENGGFGAQVVASAENRDGLETYILASNELSTDQKNALIDLIPDDAPFSTNFNSQTEFNNYLAAASTFLTADYDIAGLTTARDNAQTDLDDEQAELSAAELVLADEQAELAAAEGVRDAAQGDLDAAQAAFDDAVDAVAAATGDVAAAEATLLQAEADLADAEEALVTAQDNLAAATAEGTGFEALETVVVEGGDTADVDLDDVYGAFTLEVSAENDATVDLTDTGVVSATVSGGADFVYTTDAVTGDIDGVDLAETDFITIIADGDTDDTFGNQDLVDLTVDGAAADVTLANDLSSFETLDLTGAANWFSVDASAANFDPAAGEFVSYLIGGTASDFGGATVDGGDSQITMADARENVVFTEGDFGTVVLNGFTDGADPVTGDRIDLSQLGFTNNGQLLFEEGTYGVDGVFTAGGGNDIRISDLAGGPEMSGEIIVTGLGDADDLSQFNMTYV